jgi:tetratricopeptide (TPR) repeat protein
MIAGVWSGESAEDEMLREIAQLVGMLDKLPPEIQAQIRALPPVVLAKIEGLQSRPQAPPVTPLLDTLCASGLLVRDGSAYTFHDLVAERAEAWMKQHPGLRGGRTEADIWTAYGTRYGAVFHALVADAKRDRASEAGQRGIRYLVRARAFEALQAFASGVITGTNDPALLGQVITDLQAAAGEVPAGEARWCLRADLADALHNAGQADQALALYQQAAEEAEAAEHWADLAAIYGNWANALRTVGQIDAARAMQLKSADAARRADLPPIHMIGHELEALRLDVMQGRAGEALPAIEAKLCEVRAWWASRQRDDEFLARVLMGGLDIARQANLALERWQPCLDLLGEVEQVKRALGTGDHEMARTRFNLYVPLMELGKLAEAKAVLEGCLNVFHRTGDVTNEAKALSALASVWDTLGDPAQPIALARRALSLRERLPDPHDRAASHNNLAVHLHDAGATAEALAHQLAALAYRLATGLDPHDSLQNLALGIRQSAARGETFTFPALADLLATPAFAPLRAFLAERQIPTPALQATIDDLVARTRAAVLSPPDDPPPTPTTPS